MGRILAIDYGIKRTGLAWTDPEQRVALPLEGIPTSLLWKRLPELLLQVEKVIIGYPRHLDNRPTDMTPLVESFYREFQRKYPSIPVELVEERFSTRAASYYLRQLPRSSRQNKAVSDRLAATVLLEAYLLRPRYGPSDCAV
ncbi:MAG: Holliday junction resolvase RuvX [Bacteroidia bacterium]|nr:Holliday junction resolvase RuvX [Bacteroidia bacterium]MDW8015352.1 Holliday junction resolvase RuvX [Bacteroidia bacterium]